MNHVNAIRCNDEYQCSHCGKSWDIHEEAPDCKMTGIYLPGFKTVDYFGLNLTLPERSKYITTNHNGLIQSWEIEPHRHDNKWWNDVDNPYLIGQVNLHGLDWRETLRKC